MNTFLLNLNPSSVAHFDLVFCIKNSGPWCLSKHHHPEGLLSWISASPETSDSPCPLVQPAKFLIYQNTYCYFPFKKNTHLTNKICTNASTIFFQTNSDLQSSLWKTKRFELFSASSHLKPQYSHPPKKVGEKVPITKKGIKTPGQLSLPRSSSLGRIAVTCFPSVAQYPGNSTGGQAPWRWWTQAVLYPSKNEGGYSSWKVDIFRHFLSRRGSIQRVSVLKISEGCIESLNPLRPWFIPDLGGGAGRVTSTGRWDYPFYYSMSSWWLSHSLEQGQHSTLIWHEPWNPEWCMTGSLWLLKKSLYIWAVKFAIYSNISRVLVTIHLKKYAPRIEWIPSPQVSGWHFPNKTSSTSPPREVIKHR